MKACRRRRRGSSRCAWRCASSRSPTPATCSGSTAIRASPTTSPTASRRRGPRSTRGSRASSATTPSIPVWGAGTRRGGTPTHSSAGTRSEVLSPTCDVEVGYRLLYDAWGQGLATEGATELVRYAFDDLGLARVIGVTHRDNQVSQRVPDEGGARRPRLGSLLRHAFAPLLRRPPAMTPPTVRQALVQSSLVPLEAQVLLAHVLRVDRARGCAHTRKTCCAHEGDDVLLAGAKAPRWRARRLPDGLSRVLGLCAVGDAERADSASRNGNAGGAGVAPAPVRSGCARARPGHRIRSDRAGAGPRAAPGAGCGDRR